MEVINYFYGKLPESYGAGSFNMSLTDTCVNWGHGEAFYSVDFTSLHLDQSTEEVERRWMPIADFRAYFKEAHITVLIEALKADKDGALFGNAMFYLSESYALEVLKAWKAQIKKANNKNSNERA